MPGSAPRPSTGRANAPRGPRKPRHRPGRYAEGREEPRRLVDSAGAQVLERRRGRRDRPDPETFAGSGKVDEDGAGRCDATGATVVIFDHELSPAQVRNLERALSRRPRGRPHRPHPRHLRAARALARRQAAGRARAARAPVDAPGARLDPPRAPKGGLGRPRGPGEKQIETDRRMIGERVKKLKERLAQGRRGSARRSARARMRARGAVAWRIVGYTNAGKTTLFNALTRAGGLRRRPALRDARHDHAPRLPADDRERSRSRTPSGSSATCRTRWSRPSARRSRRGSRPTCCCTSSTRRARRATDQIEEVNKVLAEIGADACRSSSSATRSTACPASAPGVVRDACGNISAYQGKCADGRRHRRCFAGALAERRSREDRLPTAA